MQALDHEGAADQWILGARSTCVNSMLVVFGSRRSNIQRFPWISRLPILPLPKRLAIFPNFPPRVAVWVLTL